jgi:hypothetical protein
MTERLTYLYMMALNNSLLIQLIPKVDTSAVTTWLIPDELVAVDAQNAGHIILITTRGQEVTGPHPPAGKHKPRLNWM